MDICRYYTKGKKGAQIYIRGRLFRELGWGDRSVILGEVIDGKLVLSVLRPNDSSTNRPRGANGAA